MQLYSELAIGTAKPSAEEMAAVPHHLYDSFRLGDEVSAGIYASECEPVIRDIIDRQHRPFVVGGSGLYLRALEYGLGSRES